MSTKPLAGCVNITLGKIAVPERQESIIRKLDDARIYYSFFGNHWDSCGVMVLMEDEQIAQAAVGEWKSERILELSKLSIDHLIHLHSNGDITGEEFKNARNL